MLKIFTKIIYLHGYFNFLMFSWEIPRDAISDIINSI